MWWEEALFYLLAGKTIKDNFDNSSSKADVLENLPKEFWEIIVIVMIIIILCLLWEWHKINKRYK